VVGIGIDAVEVERFRALIARRPGIIERAFSSGERADLAGRADPVPSFAARFAAKEAAMKALGVGLGAVGLRELEIVRAPSGAPSLVVHGRAALLAADLGVSSFHVSLTHTETMASAVVVADA
jgi:holo-[acyl-carrier protein] synthase